MKMSKVPFRIFQNILPQTKFWFVILVPVITIIVAVFLVINPNQPQDVIELSLYSQPQVTPLQPVQDAGLRISAQPDQELLRVAISGVLSPSQTLQHYQELLNYLGQRLGRRVTITLKPTYAEVNDLIRGGRIDVAFICSLAYVKGNEDFGMELLVAPQMYGQTVYYSYLIVPKDSPSTGLKDLRGGSFALTDPLSNTGHLAPTYQLLLLGETPASFFSQHLYTYSHDNSIIAVADKLVDGAAVDSLVFEHLIVSDTELGSKLKVIDRWGPYGIPPVVVNPTLAAPFKQQLIDLFLDVQNTDEGKGILRNLAIDRFVIVPDDIYSSIREMKIKLGW
jgi:phosphonate transport system substrate-binding protein